MEQPEIIVLEKPGPDHREMILRLLLDYNASKVGPTILEPLAIVLRNPESNAVIGGLWGASAYDWLLVDLLFVPKELRMLGIGSALMKRTEGIAIDRGCIGIGLDTFSFQAPGFYERLGYRTFGKLTDYPKGYERIFYYKKLVANED